MEELRAKIDAAFDNLVNARRVLFDAKEAVIAAKSELEDRKMAFILSGQVAGKNESERAACLRSLARPRIAVVEGAEGAERVAVLALEYALDARRNLESMLTIEEVTKW